MADLEPIHAGLSLAETYRRLVHASVARIWENVYDWEHLAHLHGESFSGCTLVAEGDWGWRVKLTLASGDEQLIELRADKAHDRYVSTTLEGTGTGTQIIVRLTPLQTHLTDVLVEFHVPETCPRRLEVIGRAYAQIYARLWDEDEAMMRERERLLQLRRQPWTMPESVDLGPVHQVRQTLPITFEFGGRSFRLVNIGGELRSYATVCPHLLGPLGDSPVVNGAVQCPWHGYRFDVATGRCLGRPGLRLEPAPDIRIDGGRVIAIQGAADHKNGA